MELIDIDKLKQYIDDCKCCEKCDEKSFMCNQYCELPDCVTPQWERVLNEQPTVESIPIDWINHYMDTELTKGSLFYSCMSEFMRDWKKEQEKQNESD